MQPHDADRDARRLLAHGFHVERHATRPRGLMHVLDRAARAALNYLTPFVRELYELDPHRPTRFDQMRLIE